MKKAVREKRFFKDKIVEKVDTDVTPREIDLSTIDWQKEINELKKQHFSEVDQAVDALISSVFKRLKLSEVDQQLRTQLQLLLGTDPYVSELLDPKYKKS